MKNLLLIVLIILTGIGANAQWVDPGTSGTGDIYYNNGDVGIGTSSPQGNLHVSSGNSGNTSLIIEADKNNDNESANPLLEFRQDGGNTRIYMGFDEANFGGNVFGLGRRYNAIDYWNLLSINTLNGYIGVGTASPNSKLHVKGGAGEQVQGQIHITGNGETGPGDAYISFHEGAESNSKWSLGVKDNDDAFAISHGLTLDAEPRFIISDVTGNIGIGTSNPSSKLHIKGNPGEQQLGQIHITGNGESGPGDAYISFHEGVESNSKWALGVKDNDNAFAISHGLTMDAEPRFAISDVTGYVGVGTVNPQANLHISSGTSGDSKFIIEADSYNDDEGDNPMLEFRQDGGAVGAYFGFDTNNFGNNILGIGTRYLGSDSWNTMTINTQTGNVGIGKLTPTAKLHVDGNIISEEIKVENVEPADFVFEPNYNLMPLAETEAYIKANRHLPEVPSAAEMKANGLELGKMNMLLLQKIEEITLHMIEQQKEIQTLKNEMILLKSTNK